MDLSRRCEMNGFFRHGKMDSVDGVDSVDRMDNVSPVFNSLPFLRRNRHSSHVGQIHDTPTLDL
jgi:hypothetical protein